MSARPLHIPKRQLGNTGLNVSVLGFGASPLGGVFHVRADVELYFELLLIIFGVVMWAMCVW